MHSAFDEIMAHLSMLFGTTAVRAVHPGTQTSNLCFLVLSNIATILFVVA